MEFAEKKSEKSKVQDLNANSDAPGGLCARRNGEGAARGQLPVCMMSG